MRKFYLYTVATVILAAFVLGFTADAVFAQEEIELKFFHAMSRHRQKVLETLVDKFNKENPGIKVVPIQQKSRNTRMGNNYHALYKKILESLARKNPPDIAQVYENWTVQLIDIGVLTPVSDFIGTEIPKSEIDDLVPVFREANTYDGKLWTLPFNKSIYVLYYNKDLFKKAGIKPPATWEEFRAAANKLTVRNGEETTQYGIAFRPSVDLFGHYLYANGGDFVKGSKAVFNSGTGVNSLAFWVNLVHEDRTALASFSDRGEFMDGRCAMYIDTTSRISSFKHKDMKFDWGVAMMPKGSTQRYQFAGTNLAVFSHLSPEKKKAAVKFLRYMSGKEATTYWALNTGYLPVRMSAINSPEYKKVISSDVRYNAGIKSLNYAVVQPKVAAWEMIRGIVDDAMFQALSLRNSPKDALNRAVSMSNRLISNITGQK